MSRCGSLAVRPNRQRGVTLIELLVVIGILAALTAFLIPVVTMIRESAKVQKTTRTVAQLHMALASYAAEDPERRFPTPEPDGFLAQALGAATPHALNLLDAMGVTIGITSVVADPAHPGLQVLVDAWGRPYRYQPDVISPTGDPTSPATTLRPDPTRLDWNAPGLAPYDYVWSLGRPRLGSPGQFAQDPDATPPDPNWIYVHTAITPTGGP